MIWKLLLKNGLFVGIRFLYFILFNQSNEQKFIYKKYQIPFLS